jgi:hypothetical protein
MEGWNNWRRRILAALGSAGLMLLGAPILRADMLPSAVLTESIFEGSQRFSETGDTREVTQARRRRRIDEKALRAEWQVLREEMTRTMLEATMTMILGRWGTAPVIQPDQGPPITLPTQQGDTIDPTPPPPPPPPVGGGELPPGDIAPPPPDPPNGTPEPASLVSALLGAGLVFGYMRRKVINRRAELRKEPG